MTGRTHSVTSNEANLFNSVNPNEQKKFDMLAKRTAEKQKKMLQVVAKRQRTYFNNQQHKFLRTTDAEGGIYQ